MSVMGRGFAGMAAARMAKRETYCPWNPFPPNSPWGRELDDRYRRRKAITKRFSDRAKTGARI